jgi:AraC-like DNA-binding protein
VSVFDHQVTPRVRARSWVHRGGQGRFGVGAHRAIEIGWVTSGSIAHRVGRRDLEAKAGAASVVPAFVEHATSFLPGTRAGSVWLDRELVMEIAGAFGGRIASDPEVLPAASNVAALGEVLLSEARRKGQGRVLAVEAIAEALVLAWLRVSPEVKAHAASSRALSSRDPRLSLALDLIESEYASPLTVEELAKAAGMSRFHFSRVFRDAVGTSPYQRLLDTRLDRARELLFTGVSVTEAAFTVGCLDLGRFARAFKKRFGVAPSACAPGVRRSA